MRTPRQPHWITVRWKGVCSKRSCIATIDKGQRALFYPSDSTMLCQTCGEKEQSELAADNFDQMNNRSL